MFSKFMVTKYRYLLYGFWALPFVASAQIEVNESNLSTIPNELVDIFNIVIQVAFVLIIFYLLYGVYLFATSGGNESKREQGKNTMLYGAIGLIVIGGFVGLVSLVLSFVTVTSGGIPDVPSVDKTF